MNSHFLLEKLECSDEYKKFMKENPSAYLCSGFFDIGDDNSSNKYHFDFYVPESRDIFSFALENDIKLIKLERNDEQALDKVSMKDNFDFDKIKEKILIEMELKKINNKIQKMLFSLQNKDGKDFLLGTIFLSGLGMLKVNFDISNNQITDFEKKSIMDMMKIIRK
ncbi:hypothetical protein M0R19_01325 [Candidatus Pacearchaeota archaeon]|nr:hypothetical protein [Candidatus Pacearchaeota archaeon]